MAEETQKPAAEKKEEPAATADASPAPADSAAATASAPAEVAVAEAALDVIGDGVGESAELDEADIDKVLEAVDPGFTEQMGAIGADKDLVAHEITFDDALAEWNAEVDAWKASTGVYKHVYKFFRFAPYVSIRWRRIKYVLKRVWLAISIRMKNFAYFLATKGKDKVISTVKSIVSGIKNSITTAIHFFTDLSVKLKLAFFGVLALVGLTAWVIFLATKHLILPKDHQLFLSSMKDIATAEYQYDPETNQESFYDNPRVVQNIIMFEKLVVNLKPSSHSGPNPMAAFELLVEGLNPEVVVEIKDREKVIRDMVLRLLEDLTFEEVDSPDGKKMISERVSREISSVLTTGRVKRVMLKTVIVKN